MNETVSHIFRALKNLGSEAFLKKNIEFKSRLSHVLQDFSSEIKLFNELDCIVCWGITDDDVDKFNQEDIDIIDLSENENQMDLIGGNHDANQFPSATHIFRYTNVKDVFVIDLKKIIS